MATPNKMKGQFFVIILSRAHYFGATMYVQLLKKTMKKIRWVGLISKMDMELAGSWIVLGFRHM